MTLQQLGLLSAYEYHWMKELTTNDFTFVPSTASVYVVMYHLVSLKSMKTPTKK